MSLSSAKAKLDAQGGDPVTGYISKTDHQESYDELVDDTALTGATTAAALDVTGALTAGTVASDGTVAGTGLAGGLLSAATPVINGTAAAGTSAVPSRDDHVHASDTTKVTGPASSTDNALVRFDGTDGKTVQNSGITVDDSGYITSNVTVSKAAAALNVTGASGDSNVFVSGAAGTWRGMGFRTGSSRRWMWYATSTAESGSSAGSNFELYRVTDDSIERRTSRVERATGKATFYDVGATAGLELGTSGPRVMSGTGSPEGVVTAPVGSRWIRTDGDTLGDFEYQKRSGTGNTGWVVAEGDTGSRNMSAVSLDNGWTVASSVFQLRRIGATVQVTVGVNKTSATADTFYTLPVGFRPAIHTYGTSSSATDDYANATFTTGGGLAVSRAYMTATAHYLAVTFVTGDAWPTSLPGSAA